VKCSALVWAIGLDIAGPVSENILSGCLEGGGLTAALIVHFQWKRVASSYVTERPWTERASVREVNGRFLWSDLPRWGCFGGRAVPRVVVSHNRPMIKRGSGCEQTFWIRLGSKDRRVSNVWVKDSSWRTLTRP